MNDLQKHKKSDGVKWVLTVIAVLLLAVAVTAAITQGFKNWNPYGWLDKKDAEETPAEEKFGGMLIGDSTVIGNRRTLLFEDCPSTKQVRVVIRQSRSVPVLRSVELYAN